MENMNVKIPNHVGIILDGNGRWAKEKGLPRSMGHEAGFNNLKKLLGHMYNRGIKYVSGYLFSTENFKRSETEVNFIMINLLVGKLNEMLNIFITNKVKVLVSGRYDNLDSRVIKALNNLIDETKDFDGRIFNICFNYGGRAEIVDATKKIISDINSGTISYDDIDENVFGKYLYNNLPDIDFLIRTSGEMRISNFMLWQCSYAEFYFPKTYFPDFDEKEFDLALVEYTRRDRRFGGVNDEN